MATLKDVAKDAGVSIATVSYCLTGSRQVKPETKARIMDSIEKLKYIPNASARSLKASSSNLIGVVLTDIDNQFHSEIFKGVSDYLQRHNYAISVAFSNRSPVIEQEKINEFIGQNASGLFIITSQPQNTDFFAARIKNYQIPTVFVERRPSNMDVSFAGFDNYRTLYYLTEQLLMKHYRRIALITGPDHYSSESDCIQGYQTAFQTYNIPLDPCLIRNTDMSKEDAFKTVFGNLDLDTIEAVIATSENIADGILEALHILGYRTPEDIQVITLGEECWNQSAQRPGIIHTSRNAFTLGSAAAKLLVENIASPSLFEEKSISFTDKVVHTPLPLMPPARKTPFPLPRDAKAAPLRILMADLTTSHSAKLLSRTFTHQTGIPVEIQFAPQTSLLRLIMEDMEKASHDYDIYMYDVPWLQYMVQNGLVSDISDFIRQNQELKDSVSPENMDNCRHEGRYYGIPIVGGSQILFYRKDLFENPTIRQEFRKEYQISLRPPRTWTEFNGIARFFTREYNPNSPTPYGTSLAGIIDEELAPEILIRLWASGGTIWDKYNRVSLNTPENAKAFHSILNTVQYTEGDPFSTSISQTVQDFSAGKTAMLVTYSEYASQISTSFLGNLIGQVGYEALPGRTPCSVGWNLGLNPYTNQTEAAYAYFKWLCRNDISFYMTIVDGQSPVMAPYHSHELLKLYPWMELTEKSFATCRRRIGPYRPNSLIIPQNKMESILCSVLKNIMQEGMSVQEALDAGQEEMELLFKSYGYPKPLHFI